MDDSRVLFYFADPMCSWCWGFAPAMARLEARFGHELLVVLVMGGLRPGEAVALDAATRADVEAHWDHVAATTGQPLDAAFFRREGFVYDTEPACRAVVTARSIGRGRGDEGLGLRMLHAAQHAFFVEGRDPTSPEVLADVAAGVGIDRSEFASSFGSVEAREATYRDFVQTRSFGVNAFPALIAASTEAASPIVQGFAPAHEVEARLAAWIAGEAPGAGAPGAGAPA